MSFSLPASVKDVLSGAVSTQRVLKSGLGTKAVLATVLLARGENVVFLARDFAEYTELRGLLRLLQPTQAQAVWEASWVMFPPYAPTLGSGADATQWAKRSACLYALAEGRRPLGVLMTVDNLLPKWPPRDFFASNHLRLRTGEELSSELVLEQATAWGYERVMLVTRPGELSMRGDILDIFTPGYDTALRIEFFGDTIDDMRLFDPVSQRAKGSLTEALLLPAGLVAPTADAAARVSARWHRQRREGQLHPTLERELLRRLETAPATLPPGLYHEHCSRLHEWFPRSPIQLISSSAAPDGHSYVDSVLEETQWAWEELLRCGKDDDEPEYTWPKSFFLHERSEVAEPLRHNRTISFDDLVMGVQQDGVELAETPISGFDDLFARYGRDLEGLSRDRPWQALTELLGLWDRTRRQTILSFHSEAGRKKFLKLVEVEGLHFYTVYQTHSQGLFALVSPFHKGLDLHWNQVLILGEDVLQPGGSQPPARDKAFRGLDAGDQLSPGDLLVHRDYGLGRFLGLERLDIPGAANDYLLLGFSGDDKLYLPVDRLGLVQRYKGPEGSEPALDRLGGVGWLRARDRVRKAVERIAHDLVEMYAYRKIAKGYSYGPLNEYYREFEASFGFEETPDQARAIQDVLSDMERSEPMDRLVCGDVGFGKTEVAMRAAFRAAMEGRQVALLCPTTVLAEQHYQNFRSRLQGFPLNVAMLSRFVPPKKQKTVIEAAARGQVDILIGTHRLLSADVNLPNLGLLVLDEEQRFGVTHKEKLKKLKRNVDVVTLTATPIPRTLQLSLSGIRGLSVIETPPRERKAVQTAMIERDPALLRRIILQEIEREGQVFWVHNRVQGLERVTAFVQALAPDARVGQAHGQMPERQLEETMHRFWHGELDVLVCTAIIESGLDFPRANTLVVDQAQMFGLGQLYQLRGRVGRSDRQAYAYFVVPALAHLPETARERLKVVLDMDYLGAGFQVAMEDLRQRGAGNLLGESQSGHIAKVGLELYLEMLEEEVRRLKGEPSAEETEPELKLGIAANIPEAYIQDSRERLRYYKGFASARGAAERRELADEVRDRFGRLPEELLNFLAVLDFKRLLASLQVLRADILPSGLSLSWGEQTTAVDPASITAWVAERSAWARLRPPSTLDVSFNPSGAFRQELQRAADALSLLRRAPEGAGPGQRVRDRNSEHDA